MMQQRGPDWIREEGRPNDGLNYTCACDYSTPVWSDFNAHRCMGDDDMFTYAERVAIARSYTGEHILNRDMREEP